MPAAAAPNSQPNSAGGTWYRLMYTNGALVIYAKVPAELNPHTTDAPRNVLSLINREYADTIVSTRKGMRAL
jgi:hypothetical protein